MKKDQVPTHEAVTKPFACLDCENCQLFGELANSGRNTGFYHRALKPGQTPAPQQFYIWWDPPAWFTARAPRRPVSVTDSPLCALCCGILGSYLFRCFSGFCFAVPFQPANQFPAIRPSVGKQHVSLVVDASESDGTKGDPTSAPRHSCTIVATPPKVEHDSFPVKREIPTTQLVVKIPSVTNKLKPFWWAEPKRSPVVQVEEKTSLRNPVGRIVLVLLSIGASTGIEACASWLAQANNKRPRPRNPGLRFLEDS